MKNIIYFSIVFFFIIAGIAGCKKDVEQPELTYPFQVKADPEKIEAGIETLDNVPLRFFIDRSYNNAVTMKYSIVSLKKFSATNETGQSIELNKWYDLEKDTLLLNYKGEEQGEHKIKVIFKNDKGFEVEKIVSLTFSPNKSFILEDVFLTNLDNVFQGQEIQYEFSIKPAETTSDTYEIQIQEFDINTQSYIKLDGETITLNKWYKITPENVNKIVLNYNTTGNRTFRYVVRNSKGLSKVVGKEINVKSTHISLDNLILAPSVLWLNEPFKIEGQVIKTNLKNKNIEYKTWIGSGDETALNVTKTYRASTLDENNFFSTELIATKTGKYTLHIQARDEFGNESSVKSFEIEVSSKIEIIEAKVQLNKPKNHYGRYKIKYTIKAKAGNKNLLRKATIQLLIVERNNQVAETVVVDLDYKNEIDITGEYASPYVLSQKIPKATVLIEDNQGNSKEVLIDVSHGVTLW